VSFFFFFHRFFFQFHHLTFGSLGIEFYNSSYHGLMTKFVNLTSEPKLTRVDSIYCRLNYLFFKCCLGFVLVKLCFYWLSELSLNLLNQSGHIRSTPRDKKKCTRKKLAMLKYFFTLKKMI
jgi:hypothetical protein